MIEPTLKYKKELSRKVKAIYFPWVDRFDELFDDWTWHTQESKGFWGPVEVQASNLDFIPGEGVGYIRDHCHAIHTELDCSLRVKPKDFVLEFISGNMIIPSCDSITFRLVKRRDGLLVMALNNSIVARRWLALLPFSELEAIKERADSNERKRRR